MPDYIVVHDCYLPVGEGLKFKTAGQRVTLSTGEANRLVGFVKPLKARRTKEAVESAGVDYLGYVGDSRNPGVPEVGGLANEPKAVSDGPGEDAGATESA